MLLVLFDMGFLLDEVGCMDRSLLFADLHGQ